MVSIFDRFDLVRRASVRIRFLAVLPLVFAGPALAGQVEDATAYLLAQQQADGAIAAPGEIATAEQATAESILALAAAGPVRDAALAFLTDAPLADQPTEYLARLALVTDAPEVIAELVARQNADGGFGAWRGHPGNVIDTAHALEALAGRAEVASQVTGFGVNWLLTRQLSGGGWNGPSGGPSLSATALAASGIWQFRRQYAVTTAVNRAADWLLAGRDSSGLWNNTETSALVLSRLALILEDKSRLQSSLDAIGGMQGSDGRWGEGAYETALVLQALSSSAEPPADRIAVSGTVIDGDTGLPIPGADVSLSGSSAFAMQTGSAGEFAFEFFDGGAYRLDIRHADYGAVSYSLNLDSGDVRALGNIELRRGAVQDDSATLLGTLRDKLTNDPVAGALVQVSSGGRQAISDGDGKYEITDIAPGPATVSISADGYQPISVETELQAGQLTNFSPYLVAAAGQFATVQGRIISNADGLPLEGVRILLTIASGDIEAFTDTNGEFQVSDLDPGAATARIERDGFHAVTTSWQMEAGAVYDLSTALHSVDEAPPEPAQTRFSGTVLSSADGAPLQSVRVDAFSSTEGRSVRVYTDVEGRFMIDDLQGDIRLTFSRSGYYTQSFNFVMPSGMNVSLGDIELRSSAIGAAAVRGKVLAGETGSPVGAATVRIRHGNTTTTVSTNSAGDFYRTNVTPGNVEVEISRSGFETREIFAVVIEGEILELGDTFLRPAGETDSRGDLVIASLDVAAVASDPQTFEASGNAAVIVQNRGASVISGSGEVVAFHDRNADGELDALDQVLGRERVALDLEAGEQLPVSLAIAGTLSFRDAPISVMVDADNEIIEALERNNVGSSAGRCSGNDGGITDLAMCLDTSGSVSRANFTLQTSGTAAAIENPNIVPHDGRVRLSVFRFNSGTSVEIAPTFITAENAAQVAQRIRNIRYAGGGTAIHSCVNTATNYLSSAVPASAYQVIDVSTDGASSYSAAMSASQRARDLGIDALNALAVGPGASLGLLNDMVFPQPVGGESGFVIAIDSYQEYADAIATKVSRETRMADLTIGRMQLLQTDDGVMVRVRVGNAGNRTVVEDVPVVVYAGSRELGRAQLPGLGESEYVDVEVLLAEAPLNGEVLAAVVDPDTVLQECGTSNNRIEMEATGLSASLQLASSREAYAANEAAQFVATFRNTGQIAGEFQPRVWLEDLAGSLVASLGNGPATLLEAGEETGVPFDWNTGLTLAGTYRARAELIAANGEVADTAETLFRIVHAGDGEPLASLRLNADRPVYHTTDTARLDVLARNLSANTIIENAEVRVSVFNADGVLLNTFVHGLGDLMPSALRERLSTHTWSNEAAGEFSAVAELFDGTGNILATQSTRFDVRELLARALGGSVEAQYPVVARSEPQVCDMLVDYSGAQAALPVPARLNVVSIDGESVLESREYALELTAGEAFAFSAELDTWPYPEGMAACLLEARIDDSWQLLDDAVFRVDPPPIRIDAAVFAGVQGRLLVLLDPACSDSDPSKPAGDCDAEPYGPDNSAPLPVQREHLEAVLDAAGWTYTIVTNAADFNAEFATGGYELYALFNEQVKLPEALQRDVVADIAAGRGLLVAGNHDRRNGRLEDALGIRSLGKNLEIDALVTVPFGNHAGAEIELGVAHWPNAIDVDAAEVLGEYRLVQQRNRNTGTEPALTRHAHGAGTGVYASFDWPAISAVQGDDGPLAELLDDGLAVAHPEPYVPIAGRVFPLGIALTNEGISIPGEVRLALPPGMALVDGPAGTRIVDGLVSWPFTLTEAQQIEYTLWLRLPSVAGPVTLEAVIHAGEDDDLAEYARAHTVLNVQPQE